MKLGLINSAFAQAGKGTRFGLETTKRLGFDTVDIFTDPLDIDAAERRLIKTYGQEAMIPRFIAAYPRLRNAAGRNSVMYGLVPFARQRPEVVELAKAALNDPAYMPRMQACSLLAYALRQDAVPHLKPLLKHRDKKTRDDAKAALAAIKHQNHHYWLDRSHSGKFLWTVSAEDRGAPN